VGAVVGGAPVCPDDTTTVTRHPTSVRAVERNDRFQPFGAALPVISRPRLVDRLSQRFTTPVTLVVAPAGFGKTTLLAQAVADGRRSGRGIDHWLTCRPEDAAASSLADGLCRMVGIPPERDPARAVDAVVRAVWAASPTEVALVLDDVHEVPEASEGAALLAGLVAALPGNAHVVLSGRDRPPVGLARGEVQGRVTRLGAHELAFTDDELRHFATRRGVAGDRLVRSGGWPALAELAATTTPDVEAGFVWQEVLAGIDPAGRRDLALLAHLESFDEELATAALGHDVDVAELTAGFPLVATLPGGWRIHELWRPHLARVVSRPEVAEARRRGALVLAEAGETATAVRLLAEAEAWPDLGRVVVEALGADRPPMPLDVVAGWLGWLPPAMADGPLAHLLGAVGVLRTDPVAGAERLASAADGFRAAGDTAGELACMAQVVQHAWWTGQPERLVAIANRLFEMDAAGYTPALPLVRLARALVADMASDAAAVLDQLDRIPPGSLNDAWWGLVEWLRSTSLNHLGRSGEAVEAAESACALAAPAFAPVVESARLQARWFLGEVDEVLQRFPSLVERTAASGLRNYTALLAANCCTLLAAAGRPAEGERYAGRARGAASRDLPIVDVNLAIAEAVVLVARGDEAAAGQALHAHLERFPAVGTGLAAYAQRRSLALWYVLVPGSRRMWDGRIDLGHTFDLARDLARDVVAVRADGRLPASSRPLPAAGTVRALLPLRWATELALAHVGADRAEGWAVLDALWPGAQPDARRLAADGPGPAGTVAAAARKALAQLPVPPSSRLAFRLLGPTELRRDGSLVDAPEWRRERVRSMLAHLAVVGPVSRERLVDDLWPASDAEAQSANLRVTLTHLRRVLEPERAGRDASFLVRSHGGGLVLHRSEWLDVDVWRFDELCRQLDDGAATDAAGSGAPATDLDLDTMREAVALWRDPPDGWAGEHWALVRVEGLRRDLLRLAVRAGELLLTGGEPHEARRMSAVALDANPWSDQAHHVAVVASLAVDDVKGALDAIERYRDTLADLGVEPADTAQRLRRLERRLGHAPTKVLGQLRLANGLQPPP
jgi:transcriptional activator